MNEEPKHTLLVHVCTYYVFPTFTCFAEKVPVLVIDDINILAASRPGELDVLQKRAKQWADDRTLTVVFVSNDGVAPVQLKGSKISSSLY